MRRRQPKPRLRHRGAGEFLCECARHLPCGRRSAGREVRAGTAHARHRWHPMAANRCDQDGSATECDGCWWSCQWQSCASDQLLRRVLSPPVPAWPRRPGPVFPNWACAWAPSPAKTCPDLTGCGQTGGAKVAVTEIAWNGRLRRRALDTCGL